MVKFFLKVIIPASLLILLSIASIQYYNYRFFMVSFENETVPHLCHSITGIKDEDVINCRKRLIEIIRKKGYSVADNGIVFKAILPGAVREYSKEVWQISSSHVTKTELHVYITVETDILLWTKSKTINYSIQL